MWIVAGDEKQIISSDFVQRFCVADKKDAVLIVASYDTGDSRPVTIGRYKDAREAKDALADILTALAGDQEYFYMPESRLAHEQVVIKDARTKRKGGS